VLNKKQGILGADYYGYGYGYGYGSRYGYGRDARDHDAEE
jgi:hypothetical protein